ncbi:MAG: diadenylate cyclase [Spirochaetales bacterium]|nr:diadenylate cyclase [Spirochaetales bacterium]
MSKEMIKSIFWHDNPVHDGAAIIEGDRVKEVGGILPLSRRDDLPSHYGTRHRAAAGLAENTDALVIVVSEERGEVTIAKGSRLRSVKDKKKLADMLHEHVGVSKKQWSHLRKRNLELSIAGLVSIVFISGVWFNFTSGMDTLITLEIPVEYINRNPKMKIFDTSVNVVSLSLYGSGALMRSIRPEQVGVRLDLGKAIVGSNTFTITQGDITLPPGVSLKNVDPSIVEVILDVSIKKVLPVQVDWIGRLSEHLLLKAVNLDPKNFEVVGGKGVLENISTIYTENVPLNKIEKSGSIVVKPVFNPAFLKISSGLYAGIKITYEVEKRNNRTKP